MTEFLSRTYEHSFTWLIVKLMIAMGEKKNALESMHTLQCSPCATGSES